MNSRSIGRKGDDVERDRRSDAASCPAILHDAGNRGSQHGRARQDGGGRDRHPTTDAAPRSMDHLRQRPCGAVLPHCGTALYDPCRRRGKGRVRWSPISLARAGRDRVRDRAPNVRSGFRPGLLQRRQDRLRARDPADPSRDRRPGSADLCQRLSAAGNLKSLVGYDAAELDAAGNVELRCWACAAGALGERKPDIVSLEPSWHHNYASLGWFSPPGARPEPHYRSIKPELVELTVALHCLAHDDASRATFLADAAGYTDRFRLTADQREALIALDTRAIVAMGVHPLVPFLANMQVERQRRG